MSEERRACETCESILAEIGVAVHEDPALFYRNVEAENCYRELGALAQAARNHLIERDARSARVLNRLASAALLLEPLELT